MTSHNKVLKKIDSQISRIEELINRLIVGDDKVAAIDIGEMTAYERLTLVGRFMGQYQRLLGCQQTLVIDEPENRESLLIGLMSRMRQPKQVEEDEDDDE